MFLRLAENIFAMVVNKFRRCLLTSATQLSVYSKLIKQLRVTNYVFFYTLLSLLAIQETEYEKSTFIPDNLSMRNTFLQEIESQCHKIKVSPFRI